MYEQITYEVDDRILTIALDRPERLNAFTDRMQEELCDAFDRADADDAVGAVIVTGSGRGFCAGADLGEGGATFADEQLERDGGGLVTLRIFESKKPVIAAVNGPAVGVGATMTLAMDMRIAADAARFGFVFARRGIVPESCSSWFLPRIVGIGKALEWTLSGRIFSADEAREAGLVRSVHGREDLLPAARTPRPGDRRQLLPGVRGADPPDDVEDARRRPSHGSAQGRLARRVPHRAVRGRHGGCRVVSRETPGVVSG